MRLFTSLLILATAVDGGLQTAASQAANRHTRTGLEVAYLRLDNGPLGAPRAEDFGVAFHVARLPTNPADHVAVDFHAGYFVAGPNAVPDVIDLGVDLVVTLVPHAARHHAFNPLLSLGVGVATMYPARIVTLEAYCTFDGRCTGRDRFAAGPRPWLTAGLGVETPLGRVSGQLVMPPYRFADGDGDPPYVRLGVYWPLGR